MPPLLAQVLTLNIPPPTTTSGKKKKIYLAHLPVMPDAVPQKRGQSIVEEGEKSPGVGTFTATSSTFPQRFEAMLHMCGPPSWRFMFVSPGDIAAARAAVASAHSFSSTPASPEQLLASQRLLAAVTHPDTGELIPPPFRMASHVPVNTVLLVGMLAARSPTFTALWQLFNQSFNAAQFYANRESFGGMPSRQHILAERPSSHPMPVLICQCGDAYVW